MGVELYYELRNLGIYNLEAYIEKLCEFSLVSLGVLLGTGLLAKEFPTVISQFQHCP